MKIKPTSFIWSTLLLIACLITPSFNGAHADVHAEIGTCDSSLFAGGDGTVEDAWQIATAQQLANVTICTGTPHAGKYFRLTADIDLAGFENIYDDAGWMPIGQYVLEGSYFGEAFYGNFSGGGHVIRNLTLDREESYQGLFHIIETGAMVQNLGLEDVSVRGDTAGGIAGYLLGTVRRSYVAGGTITALSSDSVGGIVGVADNAEILDSYVTNITVSSTTYSAAGGIVGSVLGDTEISRTFANNVTVSVGESSFVGSAGGIVGDGSNSSSILQDSFSIATITSADGSTYLGNIAGKWGEFTGDNNYWLAQEGNTLGCVGSQLIDEGMCSGVDSIDYFKDIANLPISSWNITTTDDLDYAELNDGLPFLTWQDPATEAESIWLIYAGPEEEPPVLTPVNELSGTIKAKDAIYTFRTTTACEIHASQIETDSNKEASALFEEATTDRDISTIITGLEAGKTYSYTFSCFDENENESNTLTVGPFTIAKASSVSGYASSSYLASQGVKLDTQESSASSSSQPEKQLCPADTLITQNMRAGARNGVYHAYTQAIVREVKLLQGHMNRLGFNSGPEDGILGILTDGAIKRMQTFLGTDPDGMVGPITRGLINKSCGSAGLQKA